MLSGGCFHNLEPKAASFIRLLKKAFAGVEFVSASAFLKQLGSSIW